MLATSGVVKQILL